MVPDYKPPEIPLAPQWDAGQGAGAVAGGQWWREFHSAELDQLIARGLTANYTLKAAVSRIDEARSSAQVVGAAQYPALNLGGNSYSLATDVFNTSSPGKGGYTAGNTVGTAALGAVIGAIAGGGPGAAIGAVAGTGVGLGASAATPGPRSVVPPEAVLSFHLTSPATVQPVSYQEAARMEAESGPPQGQRYAAGPYGYPGPAAGYAPPPPGYAPYPYAYGYPYPGPYVYAYPRAYVYGYPYYYRRYR